MSALDMIVNRGALNEVAFKRAEPAPGRDGVVLRIDTFALTSNNVTYAVAPEQLGYWNFFPSDRPGWGRVPVWGFAEVVASSHAGVETGTRVYGYLPMSRYLRITPGKVSDSGIRDMSAHRQAMAPIYNQYSRTDTDPGWKAELEPLICLFRPLFTTSYLLADMLKSEACFGAEQVLLASASSKTALGLAHALQRSGGPRVIGLTSARNVAFCKGLGVYDTVLPYEALGDLPVLPTAFVDMAGNADVLRQVHGHFGDSLKNSCRVGLTHWQKTANFVEGLDGGPKPYFFFAPTYVEERMAALGRAAFMAQLGEAQAGMFQAAQGWLNIREGRGEAAVRNAWTEMLAGRIDPAAGQILSLWPE